MGSGGDAGGDLASATLFDGSKGNGFCSSTNDRDFLKFPVTNGQDVEIEVSTRNGNFQFTLYDTNQQNVDYTNINPNETPGSMLWTSITDGFFYIKVDMKTGISATYTIEISSSGVETSEPGLLDSFDIPGFPLPAIITSLVIITGLISYRNRKDS